MEKLTAEESHAFRYYTGIVDERDTDPFWCDPKAYVTFNSLLFDGIETETARASENRRLNPDIATQPQKVIALAADLCAVCRKFDHGTIHTYRVERMIDYRMFCKEGMFTSFISTSRYGYLQAYEDKHDLVLMDVEITPEALCADFARMAGSRDAKDEAEVLIAPFQKIAVKELPVNEELQKIKDGSGRPPAVFCQVKVMPMDTRISAAAEPFSQNMIDAAVSVCSALNMHAVPSPEDLREYLLYKKWIRQELLAAMAEQAAEK